MISFHNAIKRFAQSFVHPLTSEFSFINSFRRNFHSSAQGSIRLLPNFKGTKVSYQQKRKVR